MKVVVAMDSFKGSMSSLQAGNAVKTGILEVCPDAGITVLPLADGGEGTIDAISPYINGITRKLTVTGPLNTPVIAEYVFDESDKTAYIEMAKSSGLTLITPDERNPYITTTYGTGELIKDAVLNGAKKLVICLGGSATNDGGSGMLQALGAKFTDKDGNPVSPGAIGLKDLASADLTELIGKDLDITVASDVSNPLCGPDGASHIYGPQKGATYEMAEEMDIWFQNYAGILGFDPYESGTGAAGGMSFALKNLLGAKIRSGAGIVTEITDAERHISGCNIVITGEGRMDCQTINGKAPFRIMEIGKKYNKPVLGITGILGDGYEECLKAGFTKITPLIHPTMDTNEAIKSLIQTTKTVIEEYK